MKVKTGRKRLKESKPKSNNLSSNINVELKNEESKLSDNYNDDSEHESNFTKETDDEVDIEFSSKNVNSESEPNKKRKSVVEDLNDVPKKKKKKLQKDLYKPPTVEELSQLRETENLFHSNLFRLQIEELLNEVRIKDKYKRLFNIWFTKFKETIESLPETDEFKIGEGNIEEKLKLNIPIFKVPEDPRTLFKFLKPTNISVVGSYSFDCTIGSNISVDVMIEMPSETFHKHDYQNYRYFRKKTLYLAYITSNIGDDLLDSKSFIGNNLRPILKIVPNGKLGKKFIVHVHVTPHEESFKLNRFLPQKNSVRPGWFFNNTVEDESLVPTPHYNSLVLHDLTMLGINSQNVKLIKEYPNLRDGIILLKVWLSQRQLMKGYDAFNGHIITMYVLYLLKIKQLNTFMSSYQIVRNVWSNLVQTNWCENGISLYQNEDSQERIKEYSEHYDCVFLDLTGYHNLAAFLSRDMFSWVQREAEICLKHVDNVNVNSFPSVFIRKVPFYRAFDNILCIHEDQVMKKIIRKRCSTTEKLDYGMDQRSLAIKVLIKVLKKGLGNRVRRICVLPYELKEWSCTEKISNSIGKIFVGFEFDPEFCFAVVDKGPEANLPDAVAFREFWGNKSELRRFQDGSIREAVVWGKGKSLCERRDVCRKIVHFLLQKKLEFSANQYLYLASHMEQVLKLKKVKITHFAYGTGEGAALRVIQTFHSLEKELMSLEDIPLSITGVQGCSATFRYTEVFPPLATVYPPSILTNVNEDYLIFNTENIDTVPPYVHPLEVSLQLSTSGKWPEELEAVRKTKAAFHIQIAECLSKQYDLKAHANPTYIDVFKDGLVFRLRVAHQKEIALLKQTVDKDGVIKYRDNEESIELETKLFQLPKLTGALHGIHSQNPSFGAACCLTKRWLSAHLLDNFHIPDIVVELLLATMYLTPEPYKDAQTPQVAFLRILDIFAREQWSTDPIIVNFNNEMTKEQILEVETLFGTSRNTLPPLFISTPYDLQNSLWTRKAPTTVILNRMCVLARESLNLFEKQLFNDAELNYKIMFRPSLSEYDCLIHLKAQFIPRKLQAIDVSENEEMLSIHPYKAHLKRKIPIIDFDPVQLFLRELRDGYSEFALFFHDTYGGTVIGVLLKPTALDATEFKVSNVNCRKLNDEGKLVLNVSAMVQDFYIIGEGLVESIELLSSKVSIT